MQNIQITPRLDIRAPNLVEGIDFEGLRVMEKPETVWSDEAATAGA